MTNISLKNLTRNLTDKQRLALQMRYRYGWRLKRIALEMGIKPNTVSELLQRAQLKAGLSRPKRIRVIPSKPRFAIVHSLSDVFDY